MLDIVGYQFPDAHDYWDSNWLTVAGIAKHPKGSWQFTDPCLTTFELDQLALWFDGVALGKSYSHFWRLLKPQSKRCSSSLRKSGQSLLWSLSER